MEHTGKRLQSLDALRGFDMIWIMGAPAIVHSLSRIFGGTSLGWLDQQMEHVPWDGFHLMDLVFPLFLFIAGVSFPFSLEKRREKKQSENTIRFHLIKRALILVLFGMLYNGLLRDGFEHIRCASVLGHIGLAWFFAAVLFKNTGKAYLNVVWVACLVIGYGLLNLLVLAPDAVGTNPFLPENNIVAQFDRWFLPGTLYGGNFDPEGLLSLIPATATALLGMLAGHYLNQPVAYPAARKALVLFAMGLLVLGLSFLAGLVVPVNKALWSSSFMLLTGGISLMLLALFYWILDVKHFTKWAFFFRVIGLNSITIYMAKGILNFSEIGSFFLGGTAALFSEPIAGLIHALGYVAVCWLFLWFLYKKNIFLKV